VRQEAAARRADDKRTLIRLSGEFHQVIADVAGNSFLALLPALAGMYVGQRIRRRLPAATFMRWFFTGLIALGGYMFARALYR
jgi:uncharacterized membrane protein YfcA